MHSWWRRHLRATWSTSDAGVRAMLFYSAFLRDQMREAEQDARRRRLSHRLAVARRWERIAHYAAKRANKIHPVDATEICR